ncbi:MAG: gamma-glutamylcyclotransferase [Acidobacteria bacterium]|nr:gamma-glutamylcyclotransferase [Acidobacteriota bacterium]
MIKQIFVYGTLMIDGLHADLLPRRRDVKPLGPARCRGQLYDLGEFPALFLEGRTWVAGELYRCDAIDDIFATLDPLERESGLERALLEIRWRLGETQAWGYVARILPAGAALIPSGSYKARLREIRDAEGPG